MKLIDAKCTNCGATIKVEEGKKLQYCIYCGNQIMVDDGSTTTTTNINHNSTVNTNSNVSHTYVDAAEVKKIEIKQREIDAYNQTSKTLLIIWAITLVLCIILGFVDNGFWGVFIIDIIVGAIVASKRANKRP